VQALDSQEVLRQWTGQSRRQECDAVLAALAVTNADLARSDIDVFDARSGRRARTRPPS
jgi:hypothetical protein